MGNTFTKSIHSDNTDQTGGSRSISEEDIKTVAQQANVSEDKAKAALESNDNDLAKAILELQE